MPQTSAGIVFCVPHGGKESGREGRREGRGVPVTFPIRVRLGSGGKEYPSHLSTVSTNEPFLYDSM